MTMSPKTRKKVADQPESASKVPDEPDSGQEEPKSPSKGEQPLADDETKRGGIDGAVGGGQSSQGGG